MRSRVLRFVYALCLLLGCASALAPGADAQIRIVRDQSPKKAAGAHANDLIDTTIELDLCIDGGAITPCPPDPTTFRAYVPQLFANYGQAVDGVVRVSEATFGTITLFDNGTLFCTLQLGTADSCSPTSTIFDVGVHIITGHFHADSVYADSDADPVTVTIGKAQATLSLTTSGSPSLFGSPVTFTALASQGDPISPSGVIVFTIDGAVQPPATLSAKGVATDTTSTLFYGTHTITAGYAGDVRFTAADDVSIQQVVESVPTTTVLTSSLNPSILGDNVTFTANVAIGTDFAANPAGAVTFADGTKSFATVVVTPKGGQNIAQASIATLSAGTHNITATYSGDQATSSSVSAALVQQVDYPLGVPSPGYMITVTPTPVSLVAGATAKLTVTVTPVSAFAGAVALSCSGLPNESACTFGETTIPAGGGSTTLLVSTMSPHACGSDVPYGGFGALETPKSRLGKTLRYAGPALAGALLLLLPRRRRRRMKGLLALAVVCALASLGGCSSHCTDFGTAPGSYTFTVSGGAPSATPVATGTTPSAGGSATPNVSTSVALKIAL